MNIIAIAILVLLAFVLQYALTFMQMKSFNKSYKRLRKQGRVAIGRRKGALRAGAIVLFSIDSDGYIIEGSYLQGVTVLSRFRVLKGFEGINVGTLTEADCKALRLSFSLTQAVIDAKNNYNTITSGGEVEEPKSPLNKLSVAIENVIPGRK